MNITSMAKNLGNEYCEEEENKREKEDAQFKTKDNMQLMRYHAVRITSLQKRSGTCIKQRKARVTFKK